MNNLLRIQALNVGRWIIWGLFALLLVVAPLVFTSSLSVTMLSQMGIAIIACLSYNMLLGQGGMLSFGHAVYTGLGSFLAIHALNSVSNGALPLAGVAWCPSSAAWPAWVLPCCSAMSPRASPARPLP